MSDTIGNYIRQYLRSNSISNLTAGEFIDISESAFEKVLMKDDISVNRLLKLSLHLNKNLFEYYYDKEPFNSFRQEEYNELNQKIIQLETFLEQKTQSIIDKDKIIAFQEKLIAELTEKLDL